MKDIREFFEIDEIFEMLSEGLLYTGMDGEIISMNKAGANLLGYGAPEELVGRNLRKHYRKEEGFDQFLNIINKTGEMNNYLIVALKRDGRQAYIEAYSRLRYDSEGAPMGIATIFKDVSERELGKRALERSDDRYRRLFNETTEGYARFNETNNIVFINPAGARMLGYDSPIDITSQKVLDMWVDAEKLGAYLAKLQREGRVTNAQIEITNNQGVKKTLLVSEHLVTGSDGQVIGSDALFRDITAENKHRQKVEKDLRLHRNIVMQRPNPGIIFDREGQVLLVNASFCETFGYDSGEIIGKSLLDFVPSEDHHLVNPAELCQMSAGETLNTITLRLRKSDGDLATMKWILIPSHWFADEHEEATLVVDMPLE